MSGSSTIGGGGSGTVTSVAQTVPSLLSVSGSPITSSGTLALTYSGTALPLANGGTGQTTKAAAFDALQPMTTSGDVIYGGASGTGTRLAKGSDGQVLTLASGVPSWATASSGLTRYYVHYTGSQAWTTSEVIVNYATKVTDDQSGGTDLVTTGASWKYTAPASGLYAMIVTYEMAYTYQDCYARIYKNGTAFDTPSGTPAFSLYKGNVGAAGYQRYGPGIFLVPCTAADYLQIKISLSGGSAGANNHVIQIMRVASTT